MTATERLILKMLCRLFWLVTQAPNIARYGSDVELFVQAEIDLGFTSKELGEKTIRDYKRTIRDYK